MKESSTFKFTRFREKVKDRPRYNRQEEKNFDMAELAIDGLDGTLETYSEVADQLRTISDKIANASSVDSRITLSHQIGLIASAIEQLVDNSSNRLGDGTNE